MRVIAGEFGGRRLQAVPGRQTRPTADKVKGAIFNVLRNKVAGSRVLDLFAGTGSLAIEAISRGAASAVLVEANRLAQQVAAANLNSVGAHSRARLVTSDAFQYLNKLEDEVFDLIFLDPPYRQGLAARALVRLADPCRLSQEGVIVVETALEEELATVGPFVARKTGVYGDTKIWYLQRRDLE